VLPRGVGGGGWAEDGLGEGEAASEADARYALEDRPVLLLLLLLLLPAAAAAAPAAAAAAAAAAADASDASYTRYRKSPNYR